MAGGKGQIEDIRDEVRWRCTWMVSIAHNKGEEDVTDQGQGGEHFPIAWLLRSSHLSGSLPLYQSSKCERSSADQCGRSKESNH